MLGIKTKLKKLFYLPLTKEGMKKRFPQKGFSSLFIRSYLREIKKYQQNKNGIRQNLGWLSTPPDFNATWSYRYFSDINPNHLGNWSDIKNTMNGTKKLEYESIHAMIDLYHANHNSIEGYITSGGTEGNLYAAWVGNIYLQKWYRLNEICLIYTSLSHYSLRKAGSITNIQRVITPLSKTTWSIDPNCLIQTISKKYKQGLRGFLIPITLGYTNTGTHDDIDAILKVIKTVSRTHPDVHFFLWIDAALNGLIEPFVNKKFFPFRSSHIRAIVVDFHKMGGVPYGMGVVLYRNRLRNLIEQPIDYLETTDTTIAGSRPGTSAVAIWTAIHTTGKDGFTARILAQLDNKRYCMSEIMRVLPGTEIITHPNSLTCGIIFRTIPRQVIDPAIANTYGLFAKPTPFMFATEMRIEKLYKLYFLPHMTRGVIRSLISDLQKKYHNLV